MDIPDGRSVPECKIFKKIPAANPACVPSQENEKTLLVPAEIGNNGTLLDSIATKRFVPSPPKVIKRLQPLSHIILVATSVSF